MFCQAESSRTHAGFKEPFALSQDDREDLQPEFIDQIVPAVRALGARHVGYGVRAEHYAVVGTALLWTLEQGLGAAFTPAVRDAWAAAYRALAGVMVDAAYGPACVEGTIP